MDRMSNSLALAASDRLLILAPHPDDESIATGGLIQVARDAGAATRVLVLTDGDNNPWPQRWIEKRWHIDAAARSRWGARRREEARTAMHVLGLHADDARFLGLPDLGLTDLLMRNDQAVIDTLRATVDEFRPTILVAPALSDRHPDHSAAHILARLALRASAITPRLLTFAVHGGVAGDVVLPLNSAQRETKANAIRAHASQVRLSGRRFLRYAAGDETYHDAASIMEDPAHPLRARLCNGVLDISIAPSAARGLAVFVALDDGTRVLRASAPRGSVVTIEAGKAQSGFVKLARPQPGWRVFDTHGWQAVTRT